MSEPDLATVIINTYNPRTWTSIFLPEEKNLTNALNVFFKNTQCDLKTPIPCRKLQEYGFYVGEEDEFDLDNCSQPLISQINNTIELLI